jgi:hypothetical protein
MSISQAHHLPVAIMYKQEPVAIGVNKKKTCLLVVAPAPLKEQRCGDQLKRVSLAAVEQEEQQVCVLLDSSTHCVRIQSYNTVSGSGTADP